MEFFGFLIFLRKKACLVVISSGLGKALKFKHADTGAVGLAAQRFSFQVWKCFFDGRPVRVADQKAGAVISEFFMDVTCRAKPLNFKRTVNPLIGKVNHVHVPAVFVEFSNRLP
jgi:hypothetical protein